MVRRIAVLIAALAMPGTVAAEAWNPFGPLHTNRSFDDRRSAPPSQRQPGDLSPIPRPPPEARPRPVTLAPPRPAIEDKSSASGGPKPTLKPAEPERIAFPGQYPVGSIVIDTGARRLYYVLSDTSAWRYPISVGRDGFEWTGTEHVSRLQAWPDWRPPKEMRERDPTLPVMMTGGINNPMGAMAIYLGETLYRIHGTNDEGSIGRAASSGCFRMRNEHVLHLAQHVGIGTEVTVVERLPPEIAAAISRDDSARARRKRPSS